MPRARAAGRWLIGVLLACAPTLAAAAPGPRAIELAWTAPAHGGKAITGYKIEVSSDNSTWSDLKADTESTAVSYRHQGLAPRTLRYYRVSAINMDGTGPASASASAETWDGDGWRISSAPASVAEGGEIEFAIERSEGAFGWGLIRVSGTGAVLGSVEGMLAAASGRGSGVWLFATPNVRGTNGRSGSVRVRTQANGTIGTGGSVTLRILDRAEQVFGVNPVEPYTAAVTVTDSEPAGLRVADAEANEADGSMAFRVFMQPDNTGTLTVSYTTANGTALAGADYTETSGTLTPAPGATEQTVSVPILADTTADDGEKFTLTLSNATGADIIDSEAVGTIRDMPSVVAGPLTGFMLVDGATGTDLGAITEGAELTLPDPYGDYRITAGTSADASVGSVVFALSGAKSGSATDNITPYTLFGGSGQTLPAGAYTLRATAYAEKGGAGDALHTVAVTFTVAAGDCAAASAVCTADGRKLSNANTATVEGVVCAA